MEQILVLDLSFDDVTPEWVAAQKAAGVKVIFVCAWTGGYANNDQLRLRTARNLRLIREGGIEAAIYANASPWFSPAVWLNETILNCGAEWTRIRFVMVDIEIAEDGNPIRPDWVRTFIQMFQQFGKTVCTYSADWYVGWWKLQLGDANAVYIGEPYVHARYDGIADLLVSPPRHPLGPLMGKQYRNSHDRGGVTVDANMMDAAFFSLGGENMALTPEQEQKLAWLLTPTRFADFDRATESIVPIHEQGVRVDNGIPWFGRYTTPLDLLVVTLGYLDSVHMGSVLKALGVRSTADTGDLRDQIDGLNDAPVLTDFTDAEIFVEAVNRLSALKGN